MSEHVSKRLNASGNTWKCVKCLNKSENAWNVWKCLNKCKTKSEEISQCLNLSGNVWKCMKCLKLSKQSENIRNACRSVDFPEHVWNSMNMSDNVCIFSNCWKLLKISHAWKCQRLYGNVWEFPKCLKMYTNVWKSTQPLEESRKRSEIYAQMCNLCNCMQVLEHVWNVWNIPKNLDECLRFQKSSNIMNKYL